MADQPFCYHQREAALSYRFHCAGLLSVKNCLARFCGSLVYVTTLSFLAALLPGALPNVASIIGAVCYISLVSVRDII